MITVVIGGWVKSKFDNDEHYLTPAKVCRLHGINPHHPNVILMHSVDDIKGLSRDGKVKLLGPYGYCKINGGCKNDTYQRANGKRCWTLGNWH